MGKHENGYERSPRDFYPTRQPWVIHGLLAHIDIRGLNVLEPATGAGHMAEVLKATGAASVFCNDIEDRGYPLDQISDFTTAVFPKQFDAIITNPPQGGRTSILFKGFIETGLAYIGEHGGTLALLLPTDFDSAKTRGRFFADCPLFAAKIVLMGRIVWFERNDGDRAAPKENHAWYVWRRGHRGPPNILYGREPISPRRRMAEPARPGPRPELSGPCESLGRPETAGGGPEGPGDRARTNTAQRPM